MDPKFEAFFRTATSSLIILGINPLVPHIDEAAEFFADLLMLNSDMTLTIMVESDSENFGQSLCYDHPAATNRASYAMLSVHRERLLGQGAGDGFRGEILRCAGEAGSAAAVAGRVRVYQCNLRLPESAILADYRLWRVTSGCSLPNLDSYELVPQDSTAYKTIIDRLSWYLSDDGAGKFLSKPGDELIQLYDKEGVPRGIFPRSCFYTTDYHRSSVWGFVFNREGKLLLQQRSMTTRDGRGLWDKSVGGHVDLKDTSTDVTARRELVEELFLPNAEYSKYMRADLIDIVNFGDWIPPKRSERHFRGQFSELGAHDWIMLRATDEDGSPLTVTRISERRMHDENGAVSSLRTVFRSDVYLFIAPSGHFMSTEQLEELVAASGAMGAAQSYKLVAIPELRDLIRSSEMEGSSRDLFTDDLIHIDLTYRDLLERFSSFVQYAVG